MCGGCDRHSCSTSAETRDRKCFSMQLILVVDEVDDQSDLPDIIVNQLQRE